MTTGSALWVQLSFVWVLLFADLINFPPPPADSWAWDAFEVHRVCWKDPFTSPSPPAPWGIVPSVPRESGLNGVLSLVKSNKSPKGEAAAKGNKEQLCPRVPHLQFQWAMKEPDQDELWS